MLLCEALQGKAVGILAHEIAVMCLHDCMPKFAQDQHHEITAINTESRNLLQKKALLAALQVCYKLGVLIHTCAASC